jgi:hypothetical protein
VAKSSQTRTHPKVHLLSRWAPLLASRLLGGRQLGGAQERAVRVQVEQLLLIQSELEALYDLLTDKGVITADERYERTEKAAEERTRQLEVEFPGAKATTDGLAFDRRSVAWRRETA